MCNLHFSALKRQPRIIVALYHFKALHFYTLVCESLPGHTPSSRPVFVNKSSTSCEFFVNCLWTNCEPTPKIILGKMHKKIFKIFAILLIYKLKKIWYNIYVISWGNEKIKNHFRYWKIKGVHKKLITCLQNVYWFYQKNVL